MPIRGLLPSGLPRRVLCLPAYRTIGTGDTVTDQLPAAGSVVGQDSQVIVYLGAQPSAATERMPDVTGVSYAEAARILNGYGLFLRTASSVTDPEAQIVSAQSVPVGTEVQHGTVLQVTLVSGDESMLGRY